LTILDNRPPAQVERDAALVHVLQRIWTYAVTTKADPAREFADEIAEAACRQFITTAIVPGGVGNIFGRLWKLTPAGTQFLFDNASMLQTEEAAYAEAHCG
jgi:hypothetical protein